jgi:hypothetical protein
MTKHDDLKKQMENELKDALSIMELEERFEMTAAAEDALRCGDNQSCTINEGCKPEKPAES